MANGKQPYFRYRIIHACLSGKRKRYWTIPELIERLSEYDLPVEKRTIEHDFQTMRHDERLGYFAPIAYCRTHRGYHYTDSDYSIDALPLTDEDLQMLSLLTHALQKYKGAHSINQLEGVFDKLAKAVDQLQKGTSQPPQPVVHFEQVPYYKGIVHFDSLLLAIHQQQPLFITYKKFDHATNHTYIIHPYLLKEYQHRWYLMGYSERRKEVIVLALDRIEAVADAPVAFKEASHPSLERYFLNTIGITHNNTPVQEIVLWFSPGQGNYIKTLHLHHSQTIVQDNAAGLVVSLQLIPNYELLQVLLQFGPEVKVLQPASLQQQLVHMLKKGLALYTESGSAVSSESFI